jgi:phosphoribosylformylglycinamidine cyclo-ligase
MCVNDIIVQGARPLFFLDYFATGKLDVDRAEKVIAGIAEGCKQAGCALLGGETAEMPDMYAQGEYDLAGFCVGIVDNPKITGSSRVRAGDALIGISSSGLHSNGYSLVRKVLAKSGLGPDDPFPGEKGTVKDVLIAPTAIYVDAVRSLLRDSLINSMAHITGGGFYENLPRALPDQVEARINFGVWPVPPVFEWVREQARLTWPEMLHIFNCGIGYVAIVASGHREEVISRLSAMNLPAQVIGTVVRRSSKRSERVSIKF